MESAHYWPVFLIFDADLFNLIVDFAGSNIVLADPMQAFSVCSLNGIPVLLKVIIDRPILLIITLINKYFDTGRVIVRYAAKVRCREYTWRMAAHVGESDTYSL